ncbi:threonine transporter [Wohlfahrtiimonas chitiniclastica]|uniref:ABC-three component system middle component 2 n=1 Tax=Wohlfahrtiimonas chitiniclastica TaxID=400946 RepID=UPI001BCE3C8F|nr:ABC-three component system middle component 2 [Wohlfahrtiimonas chitiniclastica]MBS7820744.1 threonine transporter [Wohlfahrtiimonas chitiniclastica]
MTKIISNEPFNSNLETGVRSLMILVVAFPALFDLQRLIEMDYLVVHSGDIDGPKSLHAPLPLRVGELLIRRGLIENGLNLMMSRGLVEKISTENGFYYIAGENAAPFIQSLTTHYSLQLKERALWVVERFQNMPTHEIRNTTNQLFQQWSSQFQSTQTLGRL